MKIHNNIKIKEIQDSLKILKSLINEALFKTAGEKVDSSIEGAGDVFKVKSLSQLADDKYDLKKTKDIFNDAKSSDLMKKQVIALSDKDISTIVIAYPHLKLYGLESVKIDELRNSVVNKLKEKTEYADAAEKISKEKGNTSDDIVKITTNLPDGFGETYLDILRVLSNKNNNDMIEYFFKNVSSKMENDKEFAGLARYMISTYNVTA